MLHDNWPRAIACVADAHQILYHRGADDADMACGLRVIREREGGSVSLTMLIASLAMLFIPVLISKGSNEMRGMHDTWK